MVYEGARGGSGDWGSTGMRTSGGVSTWALAGARTTAEHYGTWLIVGVVAGLRTATKGIDYSGGCAGAVG